MNYSLFTYEEAFKFPGVVLRSGPYLAPCPLCLYHFLLSLIPITFHPGSCWDHDTLKPAAAAGYTGVNSLFALSA